MKLLQWNAAGFVEGDSQNLQYYADVIRRINPDVITLQEAHHSDENSPSVQLAEMTGYKAKVDECDQSHIDSQYMLANATLTREAPNEHSFKKLPNEGWEVEHPSWGLIRNHDKVLSLTSIPSSDGEQLTVATVHFPPFHIFGIEQQSSEAANLLKFVANSLPSSGRVVFAGDFNIDGTLSSTDPALEDLGFAEVEIKKRSSTINVGRGSHVLLRGLRVLKCEVIDDLTTEQYPVVVNFENAK